MTPPKPKGDASRTSRQKAGAPKPASSDRAAAVASPVTQVSAANGGDGPAAATTDILSLIRSGTARTRAELIERTGLSRSTVSQRLAVLLDSNLVMPAGEASSTGGRPATVLGFNGSAGVVVAAALGASASRVAVVDLGGQVLGENEEDHLIAEGPSASLENVARRASLLLASVGVADTEVWGFGVGLPGPVEYARGRSVSPPIMPGWDGFPVADWLEERFNCPVLVDNDVNVMALGERSQRWKDSDPLLCVKVGTGIGAGVIADGHVFRGAHGSAGDIGHIYVPGHDDVKCECGNAGCLEAVVGGRALATRLTEQGLPTLNARQVADHVRTGRTEAIVAVREAGRELGLVLAGLVNVLNPAVLVLGGAIAGAGDHLVAGVREIVYRRSPPLATRDLQIVKSSAGGRAGVIGAAAMITEHVLLPLGGDDAYLAGLPGNPVGLGAGRA